MLFMDKQWVVLFLIRSISVDSCWSAEDPDLSFRDQLLSSMLNLGVEGRSLEAALNRPLLDWAVLIDCFVRVGAFFATCVHFALGY